MITIIHFKENFQNKNIKFLRLLVVALLGFSAWMFFKPIPGLSEKGLHMIILFVISMTGIMLEITRPVAFLLLTMLIASMTKTIEIKQCFSGFCSIVPWLLFLVLSLARVITKTTLGIRLAYIFMKYFGKGILGLSYSIILTEFFIAPILPSNTARGASVGLPLVTSISSYISTHKKGISEKRIGSYLTVLYAYSNAICSSLFITAMISNALILENMTSIDLAMSWTFWFKFMILPCSILLIILPFIVKLIINPKITDLGDIRSQAMKNYNELGPLSEQEKFILLVFGIMLIMWILSDILDIPVMVTTLLGVCLFMFTGILDIKEMMSSYSTFNAVLLLGILISYVNCLSDLGAIRWFTGIISNSIDGFSSNISFLFLSIIYFFAHYFFTGEGARITALYAPFLATGLALGIDKITIAMTLAAFSSMSDVIANYTCPVALTMFSSGYVTAKKWFICGFIFAILEIAIWFSYIFFVA